MRQEITTFEDLTLPSVLLSTSQPARRCQPARSCAMELLSMPETLTPAALARALAREPGALNTLVRHLAPVIQFRVSRVLAPLAQSRTTLRDDVEDISQEVFAHLFAGDAAILRRWQPQRGASLRNFVGLIAQRLARDHALKRSAKDARQALRLDADNLWIEAPLSSPEVALVNADTLRYVVAALYQQQTARGRQLFDMLMLEQLEPGEIAERTGLSRDAVYMWRSRLIHAARKILLDYEGSLPTPQREDSSHG